jgi:hypothetical protein
MATHNFENMIKEAKATEPVVTPMSPPPVRDTVVPPSETKVQPTVKKERAPNPWMVHVKAFRAANLSLSYKEVLQKAKETYKKKS